MGGIISKASSLGLYLYGRQQQAASRSASPSHEFENNTEQKYSNIDAVSFLFTSYPDKGDDDDVKTYLQVEDDVVDLNSPAVYDSYTDEDDNPGSNEVTAFAIFYVCL